MTNGCQPLSWITPVSVLNLASPFRRFVVVDGQAGDELAAFLRAFLESCQERFPLLFGRRLRYEEVAPSAPAFDNGPRQLNYGNPGQAGRRGGQLPSELLARSLIFVVLVDGGSNVIENCS
jgi:hypothetical protein